MTYIGRHRRLHAYHGLVGKQIGIRYPGFSRVIAAKVIEPMPDQVDELVSVEVVATGEQTVVHYSDTYPPYMIGAERL